MNKVKILSLVWGFSIGGISKYACNLHEINKLDEFNLEIETACIYSSNWESDLKKLFEINAQLILIDSRTDFSWIRQVNELINTMRPDLILVHGFNGPVIAHICNIFSRRKSKFACSYHGLYSAPKLSRRLLVPIVNILQVFIYKKYAKSITTVCMHTRDYLIAKGIDTRKVSVIHNGLPLEAPRKDRVLLREEIGLNRDDFVIGSASRLDTMKGINFLIDAMARVVDKMPHAKLVIIGEGNCKSKLERQCLDLGIGHAVNFTGYKANVPQWLNAFDLFAFPTLAEAHSIGLLEAMRAGLPIVATNVGGNPESIEDGISGLLVPPKDAVSLANAIVSCIKDQRISETLGRGARRRFEAEFTLEKNIQRTANWLFSCVD
ncbi:MAG: glycosyltransferase family 4 protein [Geobacteraceae bacterium]|nr:glycosyltransferase family 4 protein [Geobacteraceae bacterium]